MGRREIARGLDDGENIYDIRILTDFDTVKFDPHRLKSFLLPLIGATPEPIATVACVILEASRAATRLDIRRGKGRRPVSVAGSSDEFNPSKSQQSQPDKRGEDDQDDFAGTWA